ncbi:hypothetical protein J2S00_001015 [Caldalkalibacillus uzonensis]|uniref:Uncharacterized protein n=1 Tax=Caldalkalibacillus uzonensis TaxID=353224 RepID=A0ABU0CP96_9BACI|nr:hypothetical protein [Caldalkalibacillus uzonensis]
MQYKNLKKIKIDFFILIKTTKNTHAIVIFIYKNIFVIH